MPETTLSTSRGSRIVFLDWLRGLAAVIMLQGHTFHSFLRPEDRNEPLYIFSQFFGGQAAAIFLFLTGVTYGLGMSRREHLSPWGRVTAAWRRAGYLLFLAAAFRLSTWILAWGHSPASDLLRVDVLNLMGATAGLLAVLALFQGASRTRAGLLAGALIAGLSPVVAGLNTSSIAAPLRNYFVPGGDSFSIFPWGAYLAFGLAAGSAIPHVPRASWSRVMQWSALVGFALLLSGQYFSNLPYSIYKNSDFWIDSPALVACKLGNTLLLGSGAFLWTEYLASASWSWVRQLGTSSLLVYWAHVELVYGKWLWFWKERLSLFQCVAASLGVMALMVGLSVLKSRLARSKTPARPLPEILEMPLPEERAIRKR